MKTFLTRQAWVTEEGYRLDASAFASGGLEVRERLRRGRWACRPLAELSRLFVEGRFTRTYIPDPDRSVPYITASDMLLADLRGLLRLSIRKTPQLKRLQIQPRWTLISCSGTIGRTVYVRDDMRDLAASHDVIRAVPNEKDIEPGYLFAFLSSAPAQSMIQQRTYGSVVQHIEPHHIADLPVPLPDPSFRERIHALVAGAAAARTEATQLLDEACAYFDDLAGPMPSAHEHSFATGAVRRCALKGRLDAFHQVGWGTEARFNATATIGDLAQVSRPGIFRRIWVQRGVPFLSGVDIYQVRPGFRTRLMHAEAVAKGCLVEAGQVLVQRSGQRYGLLGRPAYVGARLDGYAGSEHLMRITPRSEELGPWVFAFLRSESGRRTLVRTSYGTSIPELNPGGLARTRLPELPKPLLEGAARALQLREQADQEEETAIREVEAWLA